MTAFKITSIRLASTGLCLAFAAACATSEPAYPTRIDQQPAAAPAPAPPPPPPPPPPPRDPDAPTPAPSTPVQSQPLAPIGKAQPATPAQPAAAGKPAAAAGQTSPWVQPPSATDTPRQVTVGRGETLFDVAERVRTPVRAIIELNQLQPPYELAAGAVLRVPPPVIYTVRNGDTLFGIARRFNIDTRSLANLNGITLESALRPGQTIALPSLARDQGASQQASGPAPTGMAVAAARPVAPRPSGAGAAPPPPLAAAAPSASDSDIARIGKGRFSWPVRGQVLSTFGPKGPGQRNDGLNIAGNAGQKVGAAAAGEVVFSGDLPGFGNLVLLKHDGGWVTAYAHLAKVSVKMRDRLAQGQEVGLIGQTGMVDRPQLHFEVRYAASPKEKAKPVDPSLLLPAI